MLPSPQLLNQVASFIQTKGKSTYYCLFLLGKEAGLRVSEAVNFDLSLKQKPNLYLIQGKHHKKRTVFIDPTVINELEKNYWKPQQTNRFSYAHFLQRVKKELNISKDIELTPHTLRRCFATYQANNGMPLPILQQVLGHSSIRTTALYWKTSENPREKAISDKWLGKGNSLQGTKKLPEPPKSAENKSKESIIFINIHQEVNIFIPNKLRNSEQELLSIEKELLKVSFGEQREQNKKLREKVKQLEQEINKVNSLLEKSNNENKEQNKTIKNLQNNLEKALNDNQKLIKQLLQVQNEKDILLKLLSADLQIQHDKLLKQNSEKQAINQKLHSQLIAQIEISLK